MKPGVTVDPKLEYAFPVTLKKVTRRARVPSDVSVCPLIRALVLAHRIESRVLEGKAESYAAAARSCGLTSARVSQITKLLLLSPAIQEAVLTATLERLSGLSERKLAAIAAVPDWAEQSVLWAKL